MSGRIVYQSSKPPHHCDPHNQLGLPGTLWRCDCGKLWKRYHNGYWLQVTNFALWRVRIRQSLRRLRGRR